MLEANLRIAMGTGMPVRYMRHTPQLYPRHLVVFAKTFEMACDRTKNTL